jgi:cell wall-associated NlpC family hydrolase
MRLFDDPVWKEKFDLELRSWEKTPYRHLGNYKGRGADCTLFIAQALANIGVLTRLDYEYYPRDWHVHGSEEFVKNSYTNNAKNLIPGVFYEEHTELDPLFGDIVLISLVRTGLVHHVGVILDNNQFIHCTPHRGVMISYFQSHWRSKTKGFVRICHGRG